jgi:hypothetical protein
MYSLDAAPRPEDAGRAQRARQIVRKAAAEHPHHVVYGLVALSQGGADAKATDAKATAARDVLHQLIMAPPKATAPPGGVVLGELVAAMQELALAYIKLAAQPVGDRHQQPADTKGTFDLAKVHTQRGRLRELLRRAFRGGGGDNGLFAGFNA